MDMLIRAMGTSPALSHQYGAASARTWGPKWASATACRVQMPSLLQSLVLINQPVPKRGRAYLRRELQKHCDGLLQPGHNCKAYEARADCADQG